MTGSLLSVLSFFRRGFNEFFRVKNPMGKYYNVKINSYSDNTVEYTEDENLAGCENCNSKCNCSLCSCCTVCTMQCTCVKAIHDDDQRLAEVLGLGRSHLL